MSIDVVVLEVVWCVGLLVCWIDVVGVECEVVLDVLCVVLEVL